MLYICTLCGTKITVKALMDHYLNYQMPTKDGEHSGVY
jgi:hypothetical protein